MFHLIILKWVLKIAGILATLIRCMMSYRVKNNTIFNLEDEIGDNFKIGHRQTQSTMFGIEEEIKLGPNEKVRIIKAIETNQGGGKHTDYKILGIHKDEEFTICRRYKEFDLLHKRLEERWPGFYIPPIPKKNTFSKMDSKVVTERTYLLNIFLNELADRKFLWDSDEVALFVKPMTNVMSDLKNLPKPTIEMLMERITVDAQINLEINAIETDHYSRSIIQFKEELANNIPFLNGLKVFILKE
mmetsp:Transcript_10983/g.10894  ORF Transcript_10983/g.10894 Transcript_10983/m.10894 type:complete len:244 (+) Transcript_10983:153-884(+)